MALCIQFRSVLTTIFYILDWVYEEEILSTNKAMYFNNDGNRLAFARFNDTNVREFYYTRYGEPSDPLKVQVSSSENTFYYQKIINVVMKKR